MKTSNIKKRFLESFFLEVLILIKKNPCIYLYTIILDFIFLAIIVFVGKYIGSLIPADYQQLFNLFKTQTNLIIFIIVYPAIYYLFIIFIYSTTKLSILNLTKSLYEKNKFSLKGLGKFYLLNMLIFVVLLLAALILVGILALLFQQDFLKYIVLTLSLPFLFFSYSVINISHTLFIKNQRKKLIKQSFKITFNKINKYGMFIIWDITIILIYLIFYNTIHLIFRVTIFTNEQLLIAIGPTYLKIFSMISLIILYLIISFNRIYFYKTIGKNVL